MAKYDQITVEERYHIYAYKKAGFCPAKIAQMIGRHKSSIYRELSRNKGERGCRPKQAHEKAAQRHQEACKAVKMIPEHIKLIESKIREDWSPEQISGWLLDEKSLATKPRAYLSTHLVKQAQRWRLV